MIQDDFLQEASVFHQNIIKSFTRIDNDNQYSEMTSKVIQPTKRIIKIIRRKEQIKKKEEKSIIFQQLGYSIESQNLSQGKEITQCDPFQKNYQASDETNENVKEDIKNHSFVLNSTPTTYNEEVNQMDEEDDKEDQRFNMEAHVCLQQDSNSKEMERYSQDVLSNSQNQSQTINSIQIDDEDDENSLLQSQLSDYNKANSQNNILLSYSIVVYPLQGKETLGYDYDFQNNYSSQFVTYKILGKNKMGKTCTENLESKLFHLERNQKMKIIKDKNSQRFEEQCIILDSCDENDQDKQISERFQSTEITKVEDKNNESELLSCKNDYGYIHVKEEKYHSTLKCYFCMGDHLFQDCGQKVCFKCGKINHFFKGCSILTLGKEYACCRCQQIGHQMVNCGRIILKESLFFSKIKMDIKCAHCGEFGHPNCKSVRRGQDGVFENERLPEFLIEEIKRGIFQALISQSNGSQEKTKFHQKYNKIIKKDTYSPSYQDKYHRNRFYNDLRQITPPKKQFKMTSNEYFSQRRSENNASIRETVFSPQRNSFSYNKRNYSWKQNSRKY